MEKLSIWNRLYGIAISVGTLIGVLFCCGCRTSKESSTAVHSDSTRFKETVVSTIEPVPKQKTVLALTPDHLTRLTQLPKGFSLQASPDEEGAANLWIESYGKGGLNVNAETSPRILKKESFIKEVETHIRDETTESNIKEIQPLKGEQWSKRVFWMALGALALIGIKNIIKRIIE